MTPIEAFELKVFILSLYQLNSPLPDDIQAKLNTINLPGDIEELAEIAKSYPPLKTTYYQVYDKIAAMSKYRSKGIESSPKYEPEQENTEIENVSREIEDELVKFDQEVDQNKLLLLFRQILQDLKTL
ncbi:hypothetical protein [Nostoc sp. MS1]|uniref:hypothetical protein n=1 Tax=Nostoc sp. MS1 TaxID=2764711 RepID=UPI001CC72B10|nr:hypothetical protein [Nostoc sp. MS1]BCL34115.1 hypothetical protein NSMS1_05620 [Nostoc sp. MS1]